LGEAGVVERVSWALNGFVGGVLVGERGGVTWVATELSSIDCARGEAEGYDVEGCAGRAAGGNKATSEEE
jgi:hypothetical protein